ncbi:MAG: MBL fold metallo-hydrolase [Myxococcales bacterium]|nr:MBL fold metallo-hydrolase [Myxococcales bacterium]
MTTEVVVTGTGVPHLAPGRAGPGVLVRTADTALQFDAGRATALRLCEAGTQPQDLDALFVTHHHSDHLTGLVDLVFARWLQSPFGYTPLPIVAPIGASTRYVERMLDPWDDDIAVRMEHVGRPDGPAPELIGFVASADAREVWSNSELRVLSRMVHHEPVAPAVAYRVETPDGAVVISGDTVACDEVAELAEGAEVLVHEAFRRGAMQPFIQAVPQLADIAAYHADTPEVGGVAKRAGVRTLILTHLIPAPRNEHDKQGFIDDVRAGGFDGDLIVADDGETVRF